ncbi:MAG TPA: arginine--tRNA ligase [Longimicrobiales bacterium]
MSDLERLLRERLAPAFAEVAGESADPALRRSQHADFQADGALALARRLRAKPREVAERVVAAARLDDVCAAVDIAGPGFINLTVRDEVLGRGVAALLGDARLGVPGAAESDTIVVDYSAPNVAKEMHVGHLRSTVIGDAAVRLLEWLGHRVVKANHIGDWGTPFGMLIEHLLDIGEAEATHELSVGDLDAFYKAARRKFDADPDFAERARRRVVALQAGDTQTRQAWQLLVGQSETYFLSVYERLHVRLGPDDFAGESMYNDLLQPVVDELTRLGLLRESEGALCAFPEGFVNRDGEPLPLIVQKSDGGFGYAATDLAAIRYRVQQLGAARILYVVGLPQRQHLAMIYETAREAGWLSGRARAEHIGFGSVLGADGRMLRSRAGGSVKLIELIDEAVARAAVVVAEKNPALDETTQRQVADIVGVGAIKYADLSTDRTRDYVFDFDRMLSFDGNTGPYLQYAHARISSITRRSDTPPPRALDAVALGHAAERDLALELLGFHGVLDDAAASLEFHRLAAYLYGLATRFSSFYEQCPVLRADAGTRASRLVLCDVTARTLALGLGLLGIDVPEQM